MGREIITTVKVERSPAQIESGVRMTTTAVDTGDRDGHPISLTTIEEVQRPSIITMQTDISGERERLLLKQSGSLGLSGVTSLVAAQEAVSIFNRGEIDFNESVLKTVAGVVLTVMLARFTARQNGRRSTVNVQSEAAEMARQDPSRTVEIERRRKKRRLIGFKNIKTRIPPNPIKKLA